MKDFLTLPSIDLDLPRKLQDPEYRERFFLAEASAEIARQLIALRKRRRLSQTDLAQRANTQQPAVSRAEQADYQNWSFNTLRKLTNAMGGRLRVIIEPWEDVLREYQPDDHDDPPPSPESASSDAKAERPRASAARASEPDPNARRDEAPNFNRLSGLAALLQGNRDHLRDQQGRWQ